MNKPALLVVDDDAQVLAAVRRDLRGRYRETYTIISASSGRRRSPPSASSSLEATRWQS